MPVFRLRLSSGVYEGEIVLLKPKALGTEDVKEETTFAFEGFEIILHRIQNGIIAVVLQIKISNNRAINLKVPICGAFCIRC